MPTRIKLPVGWDSVGRFLGVVLFFFGTGVIAQTAPEDKPAQRISVAYCIDCVPFQFQDDNGAPAGLIIDHWRLWSQKTGVELDFRPAPWDQTLTMVGNGASDAHAGLFFNQERDRFLDYGVALRKTDTHVFRHQALPPIDDQSSCHAGRRPSGFLREGA